MHPILAAVFRPFLIVALLIRKPVPTFREALLLIVALYYPSLRANRPYFYKTHDTPFTPFCHDERMRTRLLHR